MEVPVIKPTQILNQPGGTGLNPGKPQKSILRFRIFSLIINGRKNVGPDLDPNSLTLKEYIEIWKKAAEDCKKVSLVTLNLDIDVLPSL